jgi:hypothetical protein
MKIDLDHWRLTSALEGATIAAEMFDFAADRTEWITRIKSIVLCLYIGIGPNVSSGRYFANRPQDKFSSCPIDMPVVFPARPA